MSLFVSTHICFDGLWYLLLFEFFSRRYANSLYIIIVVSLVIKLSNTKIAGEIIKIVRLQSYTVCMSCTNVSTFHPLEFVCRGI